MSKLLERFIKYVKIDTTAKEDSDRIPSTEGQWDLANVLKEEMEQLGMVDVYVDENCFAYGTIPPTKGMEHVPAIGMLAHLDTAPDCVGKDVKPILHRNYQGGPITINETESIVIDPEVYPDVKRYIGDDLVTSDGTTLLGADDKGGIAIIMTVAEGLMSEDSPPHGKVKIAFTPDEEVSVGGASIFDVKKYDVDFAITVDGDGVGEFNYETFAAYTGEVKIQGVNIHTAEAKGRMVHATSLAIEFDELIPRDQRAQHSEGHEGFYHLASFNGAVESAEMTYIIRDFEQKGIENRAKVLQDACDEINGRYGGDFVTVKGNLEYINMRDAIMDKEGLIDTCIEAFDQCGLPANILPIRGGTDGSTLAEKGLACPNMFIGGHHYHSVREIVSVNAMEKSAEITSKIIENWGKLKK